MFALRVWLAAVCGAAAAGNKRENKRVMVGVLTRHSCTRRCVRRANVQAGIAEKLAQFALPDGLDWTELQVLSGTETHAADEVDDDLKREYAFYARALRSVEQAEDELKAASVPYVRPDDYFAEMLKSDKHMLRVKAKLLHERKKLEASVKAQRDRELRKLGKQVQVQRTKEKSQKKAAQLKMVKQWRGKRKRGGADDFDVALLDEAVRLDGKLQREQKPQPNKRRLAKNAKFGSGTGKRAGSGRNTAESSMSLQGYGRANRNPFLARGGGRGGRGGGRGGRGRSASRPGKAKRQAKRNKRQ